MKSSKLRDITALLAKIMEVISWIGVGFGFIGIGALLFFGKEISASYDEAIKPNLTASPGDFHLSRLTADNFVPTFVAMGIFMIIFMVLTAIMFRNVNHVFKTTNTDSPFAQSNVNRIKRIGYVAISLPIIKVLFNIVAGLILKDATIGVELSEVLFGLIILCLSQYFAYGASLEKDVNGLL